MNTRPFVEFLVNERVVPADKKDSIIEAASLSNDRGDTAVLELNLSTEASILAALGKFTKSRTVSASDIASASPELTSLIPPRLARRFGVIPFKRDGKTLSVAALDPGDLLVQDELGLLTGSMISTYAALEVHVREGLARHYGVALAPRIEGLIRRLRRPSNKGKTTSASPEKPPGISPSAQPAISAAPSNPTAAPSVKQQMPAMPTELEFSVEDLALFPSFANSTEAPGVVEATQPPPVESELPAPPVAEETTPAPAPTLSPEGRLARAADALQSAEIRDDIADALLEYSSPFFARSALLVLRGETIVGWRCEGVDVDLTAVRAIAIPKNQPSVFSGLLQGAAFWLGPLPPMACNQDLILALGEPHPVGCLILPIKVRGKIVAFLYGDSGDRPLGSIPMTDFKRLMAKTDVAFQVYLLKGKIRVM